MHSPDQDHALENQRWIIQPEDVGQRLDRYLGKELGNDSRTAIQRLIKEGAVLVNGKASKPGYGLREGDEIQIGQANFSAERKELAAKELPLDVVYEDKDLLVINKPAGIVVHPAPGHADDTLVNALVARYGEIQEREGDMRPGIVHRLDRDTSGLLIVAKNARTQAALVDLMKQHKVEKRYIALVEGNVTVEKGSIDAPIGRDYRHRQQMAITTVEGREARTHFKVLRRFARHTLLEVQLETGRTHQIRVHMRAIGHPIVGDAVYGSGRGGPNEMLHRQFLHAYYLRFTHPWTGERVELETPLPSDLQAILNEEERL